MAGLKKFVCIAGILLGFSSISNAQVEIIGYVEYGYSVMKYKTEELPVFLAAYNDANALSTPFEMKVPAARGDYFKFGFGIGSTAKMILDFTIYKPVSPAMEARFANGSGRDIWFEHRLSNTDIGIRFGGTKEIPVWGQFDIDVAIQHTTIYSAFVFPDGTRSIGLEHTLNGAYSDFVLAGGIGLSAGYRFFGPLSLSLSANWIGNFERKGHPEYHQYTDLNDVKPLSQQDYLPRDFDMYVNDPYNGSNNSISNDFRGWKFTAGLIVSLGDWGE